MSKFIDLLRKIWEFIKKISLKVVNFIKNIADFFNDPERLRKLQEKKDLIAVSIKEKLDNGDYHIVNCLYNKVLEDVVEVETDAIGIEAESLDEETKQKFGDKDMIVLE